MVGSFIILEICVYVKAEIVYCCVRYKRYLTYICSLLINILTPNDDYSGRTAPLTSKCCILYICSTNIGTEYFKHGIYSPFFFLFKMQFVL